MSMEPTEKRKEVEEVIAKIKELDLSYREGADKYGIKVSRLYEYNKLLKQHAKKELEQENNQTTPSEAPSPRSELSLPTDLQELIVDYKKKNSDHGFRRIEEWLKKKYLVVVPRKTIRAVLKAKGLLKPEDSSFDRDEREGAVRRFEAGYPRELYQMDITYVYLKEIPVLYLVSVIDDHSRFCVNASLCHDQRSETVIDVFHTACQRYGRPAKVLTDQGKVFYSWSMERTKFQEYCDAMKIEHIVCEAHHPQTQGKVERFHQTLKREVLGKVRYGGYEEASRGIGDFIHRYNYDRPHQGIGGAYPADRFHGVSGVVSTCQRTLLKEHLDLSQGYVVMKMAEHVVSVLSTGEGIQVTLDGELLRFRERKTE